MIHKILRAISSDKKIDSRLLNRLGIQVFRTVTARILYHAMPKPKDPVIRKNFLELQENGFFIWPNFLPEEEFKKLEKEAFDFIESNDFNIHSRIDGANTFTYARLSNVGADKVPEMDKLARLPAIRAMMESAVKIKLGDLFPQYEYLIQGTHPGNDDPQAIAHSDYFSNTFKAWIYLKDVAVEDGPLTFFKTSQSISWNRLKWIYKESCNQNTGSRRITDVELKESGLEETVVTLKKNTLVMVNTHGYHRRLVGQQGRKRLSIGFSARIPPFTAYLIPKWLRRSPS